MWPVWVKQKLWRDKEREREVTRVAGMPEKITSITTKLLQNRYGNIESMIQEQREQWNTHK